MLYFLKSDKLDLIDKNYVLDFCKNHPDDIVCYINKNSFVLDNDILKKYYELNVPLVFSKEYTSIIDKYTKDKIEIYDPCYIGTSESIINYYNGNYKLVYDSNIFYTYSKKDKIEIRDKLFVNDKKCSIITCPRGENINFIINNYNYKHDIIHNKFLFLPELLLCIGGIFLFFNISLVTVLSYLLVVLLFFEYELDIKHLDINIKDKILYLFLDGIHIFMIYLLLYLSFTFNCNNNNLILLNIVYLSIILSFFIVKQCILTVINNKITDRFTVWKGSYDRLYYFFYLDRPYINTTIYTQPKIEESWLKTNKYFLSFLLILNIYYFIVCKKKKR